MSKTASVMAPEVIPLERMSLDDEHVDKSAVRVKGGTAQDEREMVRMGKSQELRVCLYYLPVFNTDLVAQLQIRRHCWLRHHLAVDVGRHITYELLRPTERWNWRCNMVHHRSVVMHVVYDRIPVSRSVIDLGVADRGDRGEMASMAPTA